MTTAHSHLHSPTRTPRPEPLAWERRGRDLALGIVLGVSTALAVQLLASFLGDWPFFDGRFTGPDPYMRLHRILECRGGPGCPGGLLPRSNAPFGEVLHWPFLQDRLLLGLAIPLRPLLGDRGSIEMAAQLFGPLLQAGAVLVALLAARPLSRGREWILAGVFLSCQLWIVRAFAPTRPDHHGLQLVLFLVAVAAAIRLLVRGSGSRASAVVGLALGGGLWVSVEGLVTVTVPLLVLGLRWIREGGRWWARANARAASWCAGLLAVALWLDGPSSGAWAVVYDRLSVAHGSAILGVAVFWTVTARLAPGRTPAARLTWCAAGAAGLTLILAWAFPGLLRGPLVDVDPRIVPIWLDQVAEYVPLPRSGVAILVLGVGTSVIALVAALAAFRNSGGGERWAWGLVIGALAWFGLLGLIQGTRWSYYAQVLTPIPYVWLAGRVFGVKAWRHRPYLRAAANVGSVALLALGVPLGVAIARASTGASLPPGAGRIPLAVDGAGACWPADLGAFADALPPTPAGTTILATSWWGPELLYRTHLSVVATPYHRNDEGILASYDLMRATDEAEIAGRLEERGIGLIALCAGDEWSPLLQPAPPGSFHERLLRGDPPDFVRPLPLPPPLADRYRLWRVDPPPPQILSARNPFPSPHAGTRGSVRSEGSSGATAAKGSRTTIPAPAAVGSRSST